MNNLIRIVVSVFVAVVMSFGLASVASATNYHIGGHTYHISKTNPDPGFYRHIHHKHHKKVWHRTVRHAYKHHRKAF